LFITTLARSGYTQTPQLSLQTGHTGQVTSLQFSRDGHKLISRGSRGISFGFDQVEILWDTRSMLQARVLPERTRTFTVGDFSDHAIDADLRLYAAADRNEITLQDAMSGRTIDPLKLPADGIGTAQNFGLSQVPGLLTFSPNGQMLLACQGNLLETWSLPGGAAHILSGHIASIATIAVSPDSSKAATGTVGVPEDDNFIRVWDLNAQRELFRLPSPKGRVRALCFSPDGKLLAAGGEDRTVQVWDLASRRITYRFTGYTQDLDSLSFSQDSKFLLSRLAAGNNGFQLRRLDTGLQVLLPNGEITAAQFAPHGSLLAVSLADGSVRLIDAAAEHEIARLQSQQPAYSLAFDPAGKVLAAGYFMGDIQVWNLALQRVTAQLAARVEHYSGAQFFGNGRLLSLTPFALRFDASNRVWDLAAGKVFSTGQMVFSDAGDRTAYNPDAQQIVIRDPWHDRTVQVIKDEKEFSGPGQPLLFSPDGNRLLADGLNGYCVYDVRTGAKLSSVRLRDYPQSLHLSRDGGFWAAQAPGSIQVYDSATGKLIRSVDYSNQRYAPAFGGNGVEVALDNPLSHQIQIIRVETGGTVTLPPPENSVGGDLQFSPDGTVLAESRENSVTLYDAATGMRRTTIPGRLLAFGPDGKRAAIARVGTVTIVDLAGGGVKATLTGIEKEPDNAEFSPDGMRLLTWGQDGGVQLFDAHSGGRMATLVTFADGGSAIITPDNYYMVSQQETGGIGFRLSERVLPFDSFDMTRNRPDLALKAVGSAATSLIEAYSAAHHKRLRVTGSGSTRPEDEFALPAVKTNLDDLNPVSTAPQVRVLISASDTGSGLSRLDLRVNGAPLFGASGMTLPGSPHSAARSVTVTLVPGSNHIEASVFNARGIESPRDSAAIYYTPTVRPVRPDLYVVAIGVSNYLNTDFNLRFAAKDAADLSAFFTGQTDRYSHVHPLVLTNESVTREGVKRAKQFLRDALPQDHVIVFFAGHGLLDSKRDYYFGAYNIDFKNPAARGLPYSALEDLVDGIAARWKLLLIDTCHAGEVDPETKGGAMLAQQFAGKKAALRSIRGVDPVNAPKKHGKEALDPYMLQRTLFTDLRRATGAVVIAAAGGEEAALEEQGNGVFTASVLEALKGDTADLNHDGQVSIDELQTYVSARVAQLTGGIQAPSMRYSSPPDMKFPPPADLKFSYFHTGPATLPRWIECCEGDGLIAAPYNSTDILDEETGKLRMVLRAEAVTRDGRLYIRNNYDNTFSQCRCATDQEVSRITLAGSMPEAVVVSPDSKLAAISLKGLVTIWDLSSGRTNSIALPGKTTSYSIAFNADGSVIAARLLGNNWTLRSTHTGEELRAFSSGWVAFSPDGKSMATQPQQEIVLTRVSDGTDIWRLISDSQPITLGCLAFLPDGSRIARADSDGVIRFWDIASRRQIATFSGNHAATQLLAFNRAATRMACLNMDGTLKVWDLAKILKAGR
jgi:WD40 repeat protein